MGILLVGLARGLWYAFGVPVLHGPDEPAHLDYVYQVAHGELPVMEATLLSPPVQSYAESDPFLRAFASFKYSYEAYQPPLYYALAAPFVVLRGSRDGVREDVWKLRGLSVVAAIATLGLAYLIVREAFPQENFLALAVPLLMTFTTGFTHANSLVNNSSLEIALTTAFLYLLCRSLRRGIFSPGLCLALGAILGAATLTKLTAGLLVVPLVVALALHRPSRDARRAALGRLILVLVPAAAVVWWWFGRNAVLYGDLVGAKGLAIFAEAPRFVFTWPYFANMLYDWLFHLYWFGWVGLPQDWFFAFLLLPLILAALWGLLRAASAFGRGRNPWDGPAAKCLLILSLYAALLFLAIVGLRMANMLQQAQGRLLYPAIASYSLLLLVGLQHILPGPYFRGVTTLLLVGLYAQDLFRFQVFASA